MLFTNKHGLPLPIAKGLESDTYDYQDTGYSATTLNGPPRICFLKQRYGDKVSTDVMSNIWTARGSALHYILEQAEVPGALIEKRFTIEVLNTPIHMKPDCIWPSDPEKHSEPWSILDVKDTKVMAIKNGPKEDWVKQINQYTYGAEIHYGIRIDELKIVCFLSDWSYNEAFVKNTRDYPATPIIVFDITKWERHATVNYMENRINLFESAKLLEDDDLPKCTQQERWAKPDRFAVVFKSGKSKGHAVPKGAHFDSMREAEMFLASRVSKRREQKHKDPVDAKVQYRKGESIRCERGYCPIRGFCNQYKNEIRAKDPF